MKRVLLVGNCNYDAPKITEILSGVFEITVDDIKTISEAKEALEKNSYDLVLVNRIIDIDGELGLNLVDYVTQHKKELPVILMSDIQPKQEEAEEHGAKPGFGKKELYAGELTRITSLLSKYLK